MDLLFRRSKKEEEKKREKKKKRTIWSPFLSISISFLFYFCVLTSYDYSLFFYFVFFVFILHTRPVSVLLFYCLLFNVWTGFLSSCLSSAIVLIYSIFFPIFPPRIARSVLIGLIGSPCFNAWMALLSFCFCLLCGI